MYRNTNLLKTDYEFNAFNAIRSRSHKVSSHISIKHLQKDEGRCIRGVKNISKLLHAVTDA